MFVSESKAGDEGDSLASFTSLGCTHPARNHTVRQSHSRTVAQSHNHIHERTNIKIYRRTRTHKDMQILSGKNRSLLFAQSEISVLKRVHCITSWLDDEIAKSADQAP